MDGCYCRKCCAVVQGKPGLRGWLSWFFHGDFTDWGHYPPSRPNARTTQRWLRDDVIKMGERQRRAAPSLFDEIEHFLKGSAP